MTQAVYVSVVPEPETVSDKLHLHHGLALNQIGICHVVYKHPGKLELPHGLDLMPEQTYLV